MCPSPLQSWGLQKVLALKESVKQLLLDGLQFVGKSEVKEAALSLGLLEAEELESLVEEVGGEKRIEHLFPLGPVSAVFAVRMVSFHE